MTWLSQLQLEIEPRLVIDGLDWIKEKKREDKIGAMEEEEGRLDYERKQDELNENNKKLCIHFYLRSMTVIYLREYV